ncbi:unnamed protein product [Prorocentrum cordatum]|uniref:Uncharacterized protein n=1 Tax=Prorocentrum cordatum TaxID=2364126 RepID=A0ABN9SJ26_9DINO|nr:unnamed protein product [Polarella glacialis]
MSRSDDPGRLDAVKLAPPHTKQLQAGVLLTMDQNSDSDEVGSWTVKTTPSPVKQVKRRSSVSARSLASGLHHAVEGTLQGVRLGVPAGAAAGRAADLGRRSRGSRGSEDSQEGRPTRRMPTDDPARCEA